MDAAKQAFEAARPYVGNASNALQNMKWEDVPEPVRNYIAAHPYLTAAQLACVLPLLIPGSFAVPVLGWLGFSSIGPVGGSAAAAYQSANGATWAFSGLQSAAMGGYGAAAVNGVITGANAAAVGVMEWLKWK